jgi:hypothetical protein
MKKKKYNSFLSTGVTSIGEPVCLCMHLSLAVKNRTNLTLRYTWKKWRSWRFRIRENPADCGRFEKEHQIDSAEKHSNEQTNA